jgi:MFS family permease
MTTLAETRTFERRRLMVLIGSVAMLLVSGGGMYLIVVALKDVAMEFGWPRAVPSLAVSMQFVGSGLGGIVMGYALDRFGFRVPATVGAVMVGSGAVLASRIDAAWQLHIIYLVMFGLSGQGSLAAPAMANIARWYDRRRGMAVGIVASGLTLAGILWPPVFGYVMPAIGWRSMFFWFGIFAFCVMLPLVLMVRHPPPPYVAPEPGPARSAATAGARRAAARRAARALSPFVLQLTLSAAIVGCCVAMALPLGHLVAYVTDLGHPVTDGVQVLSVALMAGFVSRAVLVGVLSDRLGGLRALFVFSTVQAAMLASFTVVHDLWALYTVAALYGFGYGGIFPVYAVVVREHLPIHEVGRRTGVIFLFGAAAMGFGSWLGGWLFDLTGTYVPPFLIGVAFNVAMLAIVAALMLRLGPAGAR